MSKTNKKLCLGLIKMFLNACLGLTVTAYIYRMTTITGYFYIIMRPAKYDYNKRPITL